MQRQCVGLGGLKHVRRCHRVILPLLICTTLVGCATRQRVHPQTPAIRIDPAALASSPPIHPDAQWRVRVPLGSVPQVDHICQLSDQYQLIEIKTPTKWRAFCAQTGLPADTPCPDFSQGIAVGLVALVGVPADGTWPTAINEIRLQRDGAAWLRTRFRTGLYRPLLVDAYCNLVYVKGLRRVILVEINRRAFLTTH